MLILGDTEVERRRREKGHLPERAQVLLAEMQGREGAAHCTVEPTSSTRHP